LFFVFFFIGGTSFKCTFWFVIIFQIVFFRSIFVKSWINKKFMLFLFRRKSNATQTTQNINDMFDKDVANKCTVH